MNELKKRLSRAKGKWPNGQTKVANKIIMNELEKRLSRAKGKMGERVT